MAAFQKGIKIFRSVPKSKLFQLCSIPKVFVANHNEFKENRDKCTCYNSCSTASGSTSKNDYYSTKYIISKQFSTKRTWSTNSGSSLSNRYKSKRVDTAFSKGRSHKKYNLYHGQNDPHDTQGHRDVPSKITLHELKMWEETVHDVFKLVKNIIVRVEELLTSTLKESSKLGSRLNNTMKYFHMNKKQNHSNEEMVINTSKVTHKVLHKEIYDVRSREKSVNRNDRHGHHSISLSYLYTTKPREKMSINMVDKKPHSSLHNDNKEIKYDYDNMIMNTQYYTKLINSLKKRKFYDKFTRNDELENTPKNITLLEKKFCHLNNMSLKEDISLLNSENNKYEIKNISTNNITVIKDPKKCMNSNETSDSIFTDNSYIDMTPNCRPNTLQKTQQVKNCSAIPINETKYDIEHYKKQNDEIVKRNNKLNSEEYIKKLEHCMQLLEVLYRNYKITTINEQLTDDLKRIDNKTPLRHILKGTLSQSNTHKTSRGEKVKSGVDLRNVQNVCTCDTLMTENTINKTQYPLQKYTNNQDQNKINVKHIDREMILKEISMDATKSLDKLVKDNDMIKLHTDIYKNRLKRFYTKKYDGNKNCSDPAKEIFDKRKDMNSDSNTIKQTTKLKNKEIDVKSFNKNNIMDVTEKLKKYKLINKDSSSVHVINRLIKLNPLTVPQDVLEKKPQQTSCNIDSIVKETVERNVISSFVSICSKMTSNDTIIPQEIEEKKKMYVLFSKDTLKQKPDNEITDFKVVKLLKHPNIEPHMLNSLRKCSTEGLKKLFNFVKNDEQQRNHSTLLTNSNKTSNKTNNKITIIHEGKEQDKTKTNIVRIKSKTKKIMKKKESKLNMVNSNATLKLTRHVDKSKTKVEIIRQCIEMDDENSLSLYVKGKQKVNKLNKPNVMTCNNDNVQDNSLKNNVNLIQNEKHDELVNSKTSPIEKQEYNKLKQPINRTSCDKHVKKYDNQLKKDNVIENKITKPNNESKKQIFNNTKLKLNPIMDMSLFNNPYNKDMYKKYNKNWTRLKSEPPTIIKFKNKNFIVDDKPEIPVDTYNRELDEVLENNQLLKKKQLFNNYNHHSPVSEEVRRRRIELKARLFQRIINRRTNTHSGIDREILSHESVGQLFATKTSDKINSKLLNKNEVPTAHLETLEKNRVEQIKQSTLNRPIKERHQSDVTRLALLKQSLCKKECDLVEGKLNDISRNVTPRGNNDYLFFTRLDNLKYYSSPTKTAMKSLQHDVSKQRPKKTPRTTSKNLSHESLNILRNEIENNNINILPNTKKENTDKSNNISGLNYDKVNDNSAIKMDITNNDSIHLKKKYTIERIENLLNQSKLVHGTNTDNESQKINTKNKQHLKWNNRSPLSLKKHKEENEMYNMLHSYRVWQDANVIKNDKRVLANSAVPLQNSKLKSPGDYVVYHSDTVTGSDFSRRKQFITNKITHNVIPESFLFRSMYENIKKDNISYIPKDNIPKYKPYNNR